MVLIGAIIGSFTNYLAIKMLFRPYRAYYIGKWRIPFTPGVIPSRRGELANQMGKMVVEHLLTPESIKKKFLHKGFQKDILELVLKEVSRFKDSKKTPKEFLGKMGFDNGAEQVENKMDLLVVGAYEKFIDKYRDKPIKTVLSPALIDKVDEKLPIVSHYVLTKGIDYFSSPEGKYRIQGMVDDFMNERGKLGSMLQMLLGNVNLVDKIQPEIIKFLKNQGTEDMLKAILKQEWIKVLEWDINQIEELFDKGNLLIFMKNSSRKLLKIDAILNKPINEFNFSFEDETVVTLMTNLVDMIGDWLSERLENLMDRLRLNEVVKEQVESFSVNRLEEMVLSIIQSELKMITFLGGLLGGIIGLIQGFLTLLIQ